jgi:hypothetical protein
VLKGEVSVLRELWVSVHQDLHHSAKVRLVEDYLVNLVREDQAFLLGEAR